MGEINHKNILPPAPSGGAAWCPLQHPKVLAGLSRRRLAPDDVLKLIDSRAIRWAWDISRKGSARREVRIWRESLLAYLAQEEGGDGPSPGLSLGQVIETILPRPGSLSVRAATLRGKELQRRWLCGATHIARLIADGELTRVGPARNGQSPVVLYQSVFEFMKRRSLSV
jgi:hypothetical protein